MSAPEEMTLKVIAHIRTAFPTKFGIPRQSGLVDSLRGEVIFTPEYRNADAVRGLEDFSHIWLVWQFSGAVRDSWSPTVRPPRLGGNTRMGQFFNDVLVMDPDAAVRMNRIALLKECQAFFMQIGDFSILK